MPAPVLLAGCPVHATPTGRCVSIPEAREATGDVPIPKEEAQPQVLQYRAGTFSGQLPPFPVFPFFPPSPIMAKVLGESGRYVTQAAAKERQHLLYLLALVTALLGILNGLTLAPILSLHRLPPALNLTIAPAALVAMALLWKWTDRKMDAIERRRLALLRGATGENLVAEKLANFPDDFCVINDLSTPYGNLDHVVVGPTGVYVLDAKNWRGVVASDGRGELLINGKPTDKPYARHFISRIMSVREKVCTLAPGLDPFFKALFVFTSARVEAKWGTTGNVHCLTDDQLHDYIVNTDFGQRLTPAQVRSLAQAFLALAHMDREFQPSEPAKLRPPVPR